MSYYRVFNFNCDPFSSSPDPDFFYFTNQYKDCYTKLEINIRLKRGFNLILGDIGLGKTTLARKLIKNLKSEDSFEYHMIIDPDYNSEFQFLTELLDLFKIPKKGYRSTITYKNLFENFIFEKAVRENKLLLLIIDEGQKLSEKTLELLRIFLNYETNQIKLLQVIVFSQLELLDKIKGKQNLLDRITYKTIFKPLTRLETEEMLYFRLNRAGNTRGLLFDKTAIDKIYDFSKGYPRKIVKLAHNALIEMIINNRKFIDSSIIDKILGEEKSFLNGSQQREYVRQK